MIQSIYFVGKLILILFSSTINRIKSRGLATRPGGGAGGGGYGGYEEFEMPNEHIKDNRGFMDERGGALPKRHSLDSLPEPERPPLRHIDTYCLPEIPGLSKRYTIALLACLGELYILIY